MEMIRKEVDLKVVAEVVISEETGEEVIHNIYTYQESQDDYKSR